jgi:hypothetical protein
MRRQCQQSVGRVFPGAHEDRLRLRRVNILCDWQLQLRRSADSCKELREGREDRGGKLHKKLATRRRVD